MTLDLPFHTLESHLRLYTQPSHQNSSWPNFTAGPSTINPRLTLNGADAEDLYLDGNIGFVEVSKDLEQQPSFEVTSTVHTASNVWTPDSSVLTALKSVVPRSIAAEDIPDSSVMSPSTQIFTSSLRRQTLFSVANNFAGLNTFPVKDMIRFLQKETNESFYRLVRSDRSYSSRMIVQNIFKAAIEFGDARIVDILIRENPKDIKVNEQLCSVDGWRYTPIERASMLRYADVVEVLLKHGADVTATDLECDHHSRCALDYAIRSRLDGDYLEYDPHPQILQRLLEAGGDLACGAMSALVRHGEGKLVVLILSANARKNAAKWRAWGIFRDAMMSLDDYTSMEVVRIMLKCGVDLNSDAEDDYPPDRPLRMIDAAAQRGNLGSVILLLDSGALLTGDTLPCAIASGNQDLILLLLTKGADVNSIGSRGDTPLAAAIRLEDAQILKLIEDRGASVNMNVEDQVSAVLKAALEVGNMHFMERLIQHEGKTSPLILGCALVLAIRDGRDEFAKNLIDAGADVNIRQRHGKGPPLYEALMRRNEALILSLLDADADPDLRVYEGPASIVIAAEWGNRSVIENLIFAGADVNARGDTSKRGTDCVNTYERGAETALTIAVKRQDRDLIQFLLNLGADLNNQRYSDGTVPLNTYEYKTETVLTLAVKRQDRNLIQSLLNLGADLNNQRYSDGTALQVAAENGDIEMVGFLLDQGADPMDSAAFIATFKNEKLFDLLFERCCARYPMNWGVSGTEILAGAIAQGNERVIRLMFERKVKCNVMVCLEDQTATPFGHAIPRERANFTGLLELFLQNGCNPNDIVSKSWGPCLDHGTPPSRVTALLAAIGTRNALMVELFIRYGADVNFPTRGPVKRTPLQRAAEIGSLEIVELLINHGANVHAPAAERGGGTALQFAAIGGYIPLACRLLSLKADVNAPRSKVNGRTALEGAAEHGRLDMVKLLLNGGAGSEHGGEGQIANAISLARNNGYYPICDLLESHLSSGRQGSGREMLADANNGDLSAWTLDDDYFGLVSCEGAE